MADDTPPASATDLVVERETGHGSRLGVSEISYSQLAGAAVAHAVDPARPAVPGDPTWAPIGPRNVGGRITAFAQDDSNPLVIYAGSAHGGLWVSRDAGDTWAHVGKPEHNFPIGTITIVPGDVSTVLVGTGSMTARYVGGLGLFRVTVPADPEKAAFIPLAPAPKLGSSPGDAGLAASALRYTRIRFDHDNVNRFWVASQTGLWRFEPTATPPQFIRDFPIGPNDPSGAPTLATALGFGAVWPDYCTDLLVARDPREEEGYNENGVAGKRYVVVYVGISGVGVYRGRFDRKKAELSWDSRLDVPNDDLYSGGRKFTRVRLALCDDHPAVVYAVFSSNPGPDPAFGGRQSFPEQDHASFVFRSDDSGSNWSKRARIPRAAFYNDVPPAVHNGQADYDLLIEVDPSDPNVVVCGETDVCKSEDGATTWTTILDWTNYDLGDYSQHADQHIALFDRGDHRRLWVGNDGGLSLARDLRKAPQSDRFWRKRSHGIQAAQFQDVSVHPSPAFNFMCGGGLQDNGTYVSMGGPTWVHVGFADGGSFALHATQPEHMFVAQDVVANLATVEASPFATAFAGVTNPILGDLPLADRRAFIKVNQMPVAGFGQTGPFVGLLEQDPTTPGQCLVGWTVSNANADAIAYIVPPPPAPPLASPLLYGGGAGNYPLGVPLSGLNFAGGTMGNGEDAEAIAFGPIVVGPPQRVEGWIGTSFGQLLFAPNASLATGWVLAPSALPLIGGIPRLVTRISIHPSDSWIVAVASVPIVTSIPAVGLAALSTTMTIKITTAGVLPAVQFTFQASGGAVNGPLPAAASVQLPGTLTTLFFSAGAFVLNDTWSIAPDGTATRTASDTSAGNVTATVTTGGRVFLTFDRGTTWTDVSASTTALPRPTPDLDALSPGPVGALEWDRSVPQPTQLFAGTLGGVYVLPAIPSSTGIALAAKPANIPLGTTIQLQATLATTAGPIPCTNAADWSSSAPANLTVSATGLVSIAGGAVVGGASTITVNRGAWLDTVTITIAAAAAPVAPPAATVFVAPNVPIAWRPFGKTLPVTLINDLTIVPGTRRLRAATFGRGIWDVNLAGDTPHQLFIRQTVIEDGHTYPRVVPNVVGPPVTPLMDPRLPQTGTTTFAIDFVHAYDIRVDAAPQSFFDDVLDGVEFDEQLGVDDAVPFEDNYVYVQVSSTGVAVTDMVHVFLFARPSPIPAPHTAAPIAVPALGNVTDVYPPGDITKPVAPWVRVGDAPTAIRKVGPAQPVVARFTWTPDTTFAGQDVALLAICTTPNADDRLPNPAIDATSFAAFITKERRAALRIVHVAPRPAASLYIRDGVADDTRLGGYPVGGRSPDIMVVHPDISGTPDVAFKDHVSRRPTDTVSGTGTNVIYVRVHNRRRFETKAKVKVFAIHLDDANSPDTNIAAWTELPSAAAFADVTVPASGVGYARVELPGANDPNAGHTNKAYLLLALIKSEDDTDPLPVKDRVNTADAFWDVVSKFADSDNAAARAVPWVP